MMSQPATGTGEREMSDTILMDIQDKVALLTLNRPHKLNALSYEMIDRLMALLDTIETADVHAVILTGAGDRAFSAGGDIPEFARSRSEAHTSELQSIMRHSYAVFCL